MPSEHPHRRGPARPHGTYTSVIIGVLIATFGLSLLATNLGWTDLRWLIRQFWPFALVAFGIACLFGDRPGSRFWGVVAIAAGLWIYAAQRNWITVPFWAVFGPTMLVLLGGMVVWRAVSAPPKPEKDDAGGYISSFAIVSGTEHKPLIPFESANLTAIMGGVKLDLTAAEMQGDTATVDVFVVMGGIEIFAPREWEVTNKTVTFMGGNVDKRRPASQPTQKKLIVRGFVLMGGVDIKD